MQTTSTATRRAFLDRCFRTSPTATGRISLVGFLSLFAGACAFAGQSAEGADEGMAIAGAPGAVTLHLEPSESGSLRKNVCGVVDGLDTAVVECDGTSRDPEVGGCVSIYNSTADLGRKQQQASVLLRPRPMSCEFEGDSLIPSSCQPADYEIVSASTFGSNLLVVDVESNLEGGSQEQALRVFLADDLLQNNEALGQNQVFINYTVLSDNAEPEPCIARSPLFDIGVFFPEPLEEDIIFSLDPLCRQLRRAPEDLTPPVIFDGLFGCVFGIR